MSLKSIQNPSSFRPIEQTGGYFSHIWAQCREIYSGVVERRKSRFKASGPIDDGGVVEPY